MRGCLTTLVVLVVLAVGADFGLRWLATQRVADDLQARLQLTAEPDVSVDGFPFLWQAIRGEYDSISAAMPAQQLGQVAGVSATVTLHDAKIPFTDAIQGNVDALTAARADATVRVPLSSLAAATGVPGLTVTQNGTELTASATVTVLGQEFPVSAPLDVAVSADGIVLSSGAVTADDAQIPAEAVAAVGPLVSLTIPLESLPFRVESGDVHVENAALVVAAAVRDVSFAGV